MTLQGKRYLVTGAATGIGAATARVLVARGATVCGIGLDAETGRQLEAELAAKGDFRFMEADLTREEQVTGAVGEASEWLAGLDGTVNCAGVYEEAKKLHELSLGEWERTLAINLTSVFLVSRAAIPLLQAQGGSIVSIASVHAEATVPRVPAYAASKAAITGLTRQMAIDYAENGIRVNALLVGSVATRITLGAIEAAGSAEALGLTFGRKALARIAMPEEIATSIAFLLSDDASFITGAAMAVDGGLLTRLL